MRRILPILVATFAIPAAAFDLHVGDAFEWSRQDIDSLTESTTRVSVLDSVVSDSIPADSGHVWRLRVESASAPAETLELFEFKDGAMRWLHGSKNFPVEFSSPTSAARSWPRASIYWGMPHAGPLLAEYASHSSSKVINYDTATRSGRISVQANVREIDHSSGSTMRLDACDIEGVWTDSVGPLWFRGGSSWYDLGTTDWSLVVANGRKIATIRPRLDSARTVIAGLRARARAIVHPSVGEKWSWIHVSSFLTVPSYRPDGKSSGSDTSLVTLQVAEAPSDSSGWVRRRFDIATRAANGTVTTSSVWHRWDSLGTVVVVGNPYVALAGAWAIQRDDHTDSIGAFSRRYSEAGSGEARYSSTGVLLDATTSYDGFVQTGCTSCINRSSASWSLVSSPERPNAVDRPRSRTTDRLDERTLRRMLNSDPSAEVLWSTIDGAMRKCSVREFVGMRTSGPTWVQVRTSAGELLRGMVIRTR